MRRSPGSAHGRGTARPLSQDAALELAVRALGRRGLSERAVRERLREAGAAPAVEDETIATLVRLGYLDDDRLASERAASPRGTGLRKRGRRRTPRERRHRPGRAAGCAGSARARGRPGPPRGRRQSDGGARHSSRRSSPGAGSSTTRSRRRSRRRRSGRAGRRAVTMRRTNSYFPACKGAAFRRIGATRPRHRANRHDDSTASTGGPRAPILSTRSERTAPRLAPRTSRSVRDTAPARHDVGAINATSRGGDRDRSRGRGCLRVLRRFARSTGPGPRRIARSGNASSRTPSETPRPSGERRRSRRASKRSSSGRRSTAS